MTARLALGLLLILTPDTLRADEKPKEARKPVRVLLFAGSASREYQFA